MRKRKGLPMFSRQQSLCWTCAKACGGCCWTQYRRYEPVPGWIAAETTMRINGGRIEKSFLVYTCPEFKPDPPRNVKK